MKPQAKPVLVAVSLLMISGALSGCLKSRSQVRGDEYLDEDTTVRSAKQSVTPVEPQGTYVMDEMKSELTRLTGRIEELERGKKDDKGSDATKEQLKKMETRMTELEQAQASMIEALKKMQEGGGAATPTGDTGPLFEKGKKHYEEEEYEEAIEAFSGYLKNPKAKKAEEATFLRAESYYRAKQYKKAIVDYSKFPEKFTKSAHMPTALYKIGLSFESLGMKEDAKGFYQELAEKFPKSVEAKKVKGKLK